MPVNPGLSSYYQSRLRVVCSSGCKVAQILHNHRKVASTVTKSELLSAVDDGVCAKACDLPNQWHPLTKMLNVHSGVAPVSSFQFCTDAVGSSELLKLCRRFYTAEGVAAP